MRGLWERSWEAFVLSLYKRQEPVNTNNPRGSLPRLQLELKIYYILRGLLLWIDLIYDWELILQWAWIRLRHCIGHSESYTCPTSTSTTVVVHSYGGTTVSWFCLGSQRTTHSTPWKPQPRHCGWVSRLRITVSVESVSLVRQTVCERKTVGREEVLEANLKVRSS